MPTKKCRKMKRFSCAQAKRCFFYLTGITFQINPFGWVLVYLSQNAKDIEDALGIIWHVLASITLTKDT
jgi:hypothetical protein